MSFSVSSAFSTLQSALSAAGASTESAASGAASLVHSLFGSSIGTTVKPFLVTIMGNYNNPAVVSDCITKIEETSGLPMTVAPLLNQLQAAAASAASTPATGIAELSGIIGAIEAELGN